jgi:predicted DNA-binding transcriptional regulator AlpA
MTADTSPNSAAAIPPQRGRPGNDLLSIPEVIAELGVPRSTFYRWRQTGVGPKAIKLPNGQVRVRRAVLEEWLQGLESARP